MRHFNRTSSRQVRRQLLVARKAQGRLLSRITIYCGLTSCCTALLCLVIQSQGAATVLAVSIPTTLISLGPFLLYDAARLSNRLVGPIVRVQGAIRGIANGDPVAPLETRGDEEWREWIQDFNMMVVRLEAKRVVADASEEHREGAVG